MSIIIYTARTAAVQMMHLVAGDPPNEYKSSPESYAADAVKLTAAEMIRLGYPPIRVGDYFGAVLTLYGTVSGTPTAIPYNPSADPDSTACECVLWEQGSAEVAASWVCTMEGSPSPGVVAISPAAPYIVDTPAGLYNFAVRRTETVGADEYPHVLCSGQIEILPGIPEVAA